MVASQTGRDKICAWGLADIGMHPARSVLKHICTRGMGGEVVGAREGKGGCLWKGDRLIGQRMRTLHRVVCVCVYTCAHTHAHE